MLVCKLEGSALLRPRGPALKVQVTSLRVHEWPAGGGLPVVMVCRTTRRRQGAEHYVPVMR
jgi:hypothetical protein